MEIWGGFRNEGQGKGGESGRGERKWKRRERGKGRGGENMGGRTGQDKLKHQTDPFTDLFNTEMK